MGNAGLNLDPLSQPAKLSHRFALGADFTVFWTCACSDVPSKPAGGPACSPDGWLQFSPDAVEKPDRPRCGLFPVIDGSAPNICLHSWLSC
jgi:hypothetical protein